jgi:outer membrane lipoprotein SlyB
MTTTNRFGSVLGSVLGMVSVLTLGACGTMNDPFNTSGSGTANPATGSSGSAYSGYGEVDSIERVGQGNTGIGGSGIGLGTIAGAAAGAYVGHELENRQQKTTGTYKFTIRMDNGSYQTMMEDTDTGFRVGDRVRVEDGYLQRY